MKKSFGQGWKVTEKKTGSPVNKTALRSNMTLEK